MGMNRKKKSTPVKDITRTEGKNRTGSGSPNKVGAKGREVAKKKNLEMVGRRLTETIGDNAIFLHGNAAGGSPQSKGRARGRAQQLTGVGFSGEAKGREKSGNLQRGVAKVSKAGKVVVQGVSPADKPSREIATDAKIRQFEGIASPKQGERKSPDGKFAMPKPGMRTSRRLQKLEVEAKPLESEQQIKKFLRAEDVLISSHAAAASGGGKAIDGQQKEEEPAEEQEEIRENSSNSDALVSSHTTATAHGKKAIQGEQKDADEQQEEQGRNEEIEEISSNSDASDEKERDEGMGETSNATRGDRHQETAAESHQEIVPLTEPTPTEAPSSPVEEPSRPEAHQKIVDRFAISHAKLAERWNQLGEISTRILLLDAGFRSQTVRPCLSSHLLAGWDERLERPAAKDLSGDVSGATIVGVQKRDDLAGNIEFPSEEAAARSTKRRKVSIRETVELGGSLVRTDGQAIDGRVEVRVTDGSAHDERWPSEQEAVVANRNAQCQNLIHATGDLIPAATGTELTAIETNQYNGSQAGAQQTANGMVPLDDHGLCLAVAVVQAGQVRAEHDNLLALPCDGRIWEEQTHLDGQLVERHEIDTCDLQLQQMQTEIETLLVQSAASMAPRQLMNQAVARADVRGVVADGVRARREMEEQARRGREREREMEREMERYWAECRREEPLLLTTDGEGGDEEGMEAKVQEEGEGEQGRSTRVAGAGADNSTGVGKRMEGAAMASDNGRGGGNDEGSAGVDGDAGRPGLGREGSEGGDGRTGDADVAGGGGREGGRER